MTEGTVTGWGRSENLEKMHESLPKVVLAPIQTNNECFFDGGKDLVDMSSPRTFCAGLKNGSGVCTGDSGAGHFFKFNGAYHLKGVVSSSLINDFNCDVTRSAVYTNVFKFKDWIKKETGGE